MGNRNRARGRGYKASSSGGGGTTGPLDPLDFEHTFAVYRADAAENIAAVYTSTFTANTGANRIEPASAPSPTFAAATGYPPIASTQTFSKLGRGLPVYFSTTGTLPSPLVAGTPYFLSEVTGGFAVYPYATEADIGVTLQSALPKENVLPAQRYYEGLFPVVLASAGSGTHTVSTVNPAVSFIEDLKSGLFGLIPTDQSSDRNAHIRAITDGDGDIYLQTAETCKIDYSGSSQTPYGTQCIVAANRTAGNAIVSEKRTLAIITLCRIDESDTRQYVKQTSDSTRVNTTTNAITINLTIDDESSVRFTTAQAVKLKPAPGGTLPAPLSPSTVYYVRVSGSTVTLHPTSADATANTNTIDLTTAGSGGFTIYAHQMPGSLQRGNFLVEWIEPLDGGGNSLSPRLAPAYEAGNYATSNFVTSGGSAGNCNFFNGLTGDVIDFWVPEGSALPTGLSEGVTYYVRRPNETSGTCTLHPTLADAEAGTNKIVFSGAGAGTVTVRYNDGKAEMVLGTYLGSEVDTMGYRFEYGRKQIMVMLVDYNPGDADAPVGWFGINEPRTVSREIQGTKGNLPTATVKAGNPWSVFNAAQPHRPINEHFYYMAMIASPTAIDYNTIARMVNWIGQEYTVPDFTPVALLDYTVPDAPTITGCVGGNGKITVTFTPGFNGNVALTDFVARYRVQGSGGAYTTYADATSTATVIVIDHPDIVNGTTYEVVVAAVNDIGTGEDSAPSTATAQEPIASPEDINGLNFWLDASDAASFTQSGGTVTAITDKSTAANSPQAVTNILTGSRTVDGKNAFDFNGTSSTILLANALETMTADNHTVFILYATDNIGISTQTLINGTISAGSSRYSLILDTTNDRFRFANNTLSQTNLTLNLGVTLDTSAHLVDGMRSGTTLSLGFDGVTGASAEYAGDVTITGLTLGNHGGTSTNWFNGAMCEVLIYGRALTGGERQQVREYLMDKWGLV